MKPTHVKPSLYAFFYEEAKEAAKAFGYNILLHGSMQRDLDLVAVPWQENASDPVAMVTRLAEIIGGKLQMQWDSKKDTHEPFTTTHHGRMYFIIDILRIGKNGAEDPQYYLDISVMPRIVDQNSKTA